MANAISGNELRTMFEGVGDEYKDILVRNAENKKLLIDCIGEINKTIDNVSQLSPSPELVFNAFKLCPWDKLRVVLIGQDPYPTDATGLCFSLPPNAKIPKSLTNIHTALMRAGEIDVVPDNGDLSGWATQGVLMINAALTTVAGKRGAHQVAWAKYVKKILTDIAEKKSQDGDMLVFMLWGNHAMKFKSILDVVNYNAIANKKTIHKSVCWGHPSAASTNNNGSPDDSNKHFGNNDNFTLVNTHLKSINAETIKW